MKRKVAILPNLCVHEKVSQEVPPTAIPKLTIKTLHEKVECVLYLLSRHNNDVAIL